MARSHESQDEPRGRVIALDDPAVAQILLSRPVPAGGPWDSLPKSPIGDYAVAGRSLIDSVYDALWSTGGLGWAVVDTGLASHPDVDVLTAFWNLWATLFNPVQQYRSGQLLHTVEVIKESRDLASHYSHSNKSGDFHTDGTLLDETPEVVALGGLQTADTGGETVLVDGFDLAARFRRSDSDAVLAARHPFHSGIPADPVVHFPVIAQESGRPVIRYMRRYIELGYRHLGADPSPTLVEAMDDLDTGVDDHEIQEAILVERGAILVWNNHRYLHGRRGFTEKNRRRRLLRAYGVRRQ